MGLYIAKITKFVFTRLRVWIFLMLSTVTNFCAYALYLAKRSLSLKAMPAVSLSSRNSLFRTLQLDLMLSVAKKANIPVTRIEGFKRTQGRWHICVKDIGWLRTSDLLHLSIKLYPPLEAKR
jgi:hypothetical protein